MPVTAGGLLARHDYDPVTDAAVGWSIEPGSSVVQAVRLDPNAVVGEVSVKLRRIGGAGPASLRLGTRPGDDDLGRGTIAPAAVDPWFEHWVTVRFEPSIRPLGDVVYLQVGVPEHSPGGYEWFGTASASVDRTEFAARFRYVATFDPQPDALGEFENPANIDYGTRTKHYDEGDAFDHDGARIPGLSLAFVITGPDPEASDEEERFAFVRGITGPLVTSRLRDAARTPGAGEVGIDDAWALVDETDGPAAGVAAREFDEFLRAAMGVRLGGRVGSATISVSTDADVDLEPEGFLVDVGPGRVGIVGRDDRGAMRGLHYVERAMRQRRAPFLRLGVVRREPRFSPRITCAPFYAKEELTAAVSPYTDGLLGRIARAGFNAIWVWGDLDRIAHSDVYPELDRGVALRQRRLCDLIERARRYGIDVYLYLASRPLPDRFFDRHPDARGSELHAYDGTHVICTSVPRVRAHLRSATSDLGRSVPGLAGVVCIVGGEGLMHCYSRRNTCPRCRARPPHETVAELVQALAGGLRSTNPRAAVAIWPYSATNTWSSDDPTQARLIERLPDGVTWLTEFAKEGAVTHGGRTIPAFDYPISITGPSDRFVAQAELVDKRGLDLWVKTEHAIALEFIQTPYIPAFAQWAERYGRLRDGPASGVFANWMHYGFLPGPATELFYRAMWSDPVDADRLVSDLAALYGDVAGHMVSAWRHFSTGIGRYPFSGPMAAGVIQQGPAHPLFFDPTYRPAYGALRQFAGDLAWTEPWGPDLAVERLEAMDGHWSQGVVDLEKAVGVADESVRDAVCRELGIAVTLGACVRSAIHVARFTLLRDGLATAGPATAQRLLREMTEIAEAEIRNARAVLPHVRSDSRLGYANSGAGDQVGVPRAGIYSPVSIEKKIAQVIRVLDEDIPAYRRARGFD